MASYAALAVQTREYIIIVMWAGQLAGELFNWLLKHAIKEDRPIAFLVMQKVLEMAMVFRPRTANIWPILHLSSIWRAVVYFGLVVWAATVAYSRYRLGYHNANQILWGIAIGATSGTSLYTFAELIPRRRPTSIFGSIKGSLLTNPVSTWLQIRDGWAVWADGGRESEWIRWKAEWEKQCLVERKRSD